MTGVGKGRRVPATARLSEFPKTAADQARWWEKHILEVPDGLPPDAPAGTVPRPEFAPERNSPAQRERAKAAEPTATGHAMTAGGIKQRRRRYQRTVRLALDTSRPAKRDVTRGKDPLRGRLIGLIDSMSTDNLNVRGIWTNLMDEHDHSVSYASVRYHLKHRQDREARPEDEAAQPDLSRTP